MEDLYPVKGIASYFRIQGAGQEYFFIHRDSSPLTKYQFWRMTDLALNKVGMQGLKFSTHSFRIRAASIAAGLGCHVEDIKRIGLWSSNYCRYIRTSPNI